MKPPPQDILRDDYARSLDVFKTLVDVRFRLLVLVPGAAAVTTGLLGAKNDPGAARFALALLGLVATCGVIVYEVRNSQLHDAVVHRLKFLELLLGQPAASFSGVGGLMNERPSKPTVLLVPLWHDLALSVVYGASIAAWVWLLISSPSPVPDLLNASCANGVPAPSPAWWPLACWPYSPLILVGTSVMAGLLASRCVIVLSRSSRPSSTCTAIIRDPKGSIERLDVVDSTKLLLDKLVEHKMKKSRICEHDADLACLLGLAVREDVRGVLFTRRLRFILRHAGCLEVGSKRRCPEKGRFRIVGERRRAITWIQATEEGEKYQAIESASERRAELSRILTRRMYFYQEVKKLVPLVNDAEELHRIVSAGTYAPWLDLAQIRFRVDLSRELESPEVRPPI
ncbi:hypothetical protein LWC33_13120 [Pseudonocardia sp. RS11V-5]|uniref:hypothetical protein n=1 Tax=Pseudonocardia terrae TaxID=2905831 RepID=UPI001E4A0ED3|nr:hypothetical protein [Pseudonocardia terrae]MCE3552399.1 hypothetical protein [Pseudonocardia terrae]